MTARPRRGWRDRRGNIAIMTALLGIPLFGIVGLATDGARAWLLQSRLHTALDAAALAGARNINLPPAQRDAEVAAMFWTNFRPPALPAIPGGAPTGRAEQGYMAASTTLSAPRAVDGNTMEVAAVAVMDTVFARVLGFPTLTVRASAEARRADLGMELSLVLDVTGSMDTNCTTPGDRTAANCGVTDVPRLPGQTVTSRNSNIDLLRVAAADLVNILYGDRDTVPNLWVSVVPYSSTVNLGPTRTSWLAPDAAANLTGDFAPTTWRGCVEARAGVPGMPADGDRRDYTPAEVPFRPFLNASTLGVYTLAGARVIGDNDWDRKLWNASTTGTDAITEDYQLWRGNFQVGPNVGCPQTPVLPLTASKTTVLNTIQSLRSTFRGGTMANLGLQAGWFTLSPRWRQAWGLGPPPAGHATALPLDYRTQFMRKVIVLMTDGANNWHDFNYGYPGLCTDTRTPSVQSFPTVAASVPPPGPPQPVRGNTCPTAAAAGTNGANITVAPGGPPIAGNADYTGYGRLAERRLGAGVGTNAQANTELNARMAALCTAIRSASGQAPANQDIIIYSVILGTTDAATRTLYEGCATSPQNFFLVTQPDQLRAAFQQIGTQLANLRLVR
jgi:Flp pilus assembly protein TadG